MDTQLVVRAQHGDREAFAELATATVDRLLAVARGVLGDAQLAEDATQQALLDIWRHLPDLRDAERFEGWSYRVLVNACRSEQRRSRRWISGVIAPLSFEPAAPDELVSVLDRDELEHAFRDLSVDHRAVLVLRYYLDLSLEAIAESLGVPIGTVNSRLHRALGRMREALAEPNPTSAPEGALR